MGKNATLRSYRQKTAFLGGRVTSAWLNGKKFDFSVELGFGIGLGLWYIGMIQGIG